MVAAVFAIYAALPMVALSALPVHRGADGKYTTLLGTDEAHGGFAGDPVLGIVKHLHLGALQSAAEIYVGILAATILFIAANAGIIGASRLVYSMGLHRQVPDRLSRLHPRYSTPWIGILLFGGVACLTIIPGQAVFLGNMYAFGAMLSFTVAHSRGDPIADRTSPDRPRPLPRPRDAARARARAAAVRGARRPRHGPRVRGRDDPASRPSPPPVSFWLALGMAVYVVFRRSQGLDLRTTVKAPRPRAPGRLRGVRLRHRARADLRRRRQRGGARRALRS